MAPANEIGNIVKAHKPSGKLDATQLSGRWYNKATMYPSLVPLLQCVTCGQSLELGRVDRVHASEEVIEGVLTCAEGHTWPIEAGVLVLSREDALSDAWTRSLDTYEAYAESQAEAVREKQRNVVPLRDRIPVGGRSPVLDLCTGRGVLLFNMLPHLASDVDVIAVDMSLTIQTYNRRYWRERYGDRKVSFIACDATALPFRADVIPHAMAFGMGNMLHQMQQGVHEAARVLAEGGTFCFNHQYVAEDSQGWRTLTGLMHELGQRDFRYLGIEDAFVALMRATAFDAYDIEVIAEVIGDADRDLDTGIFPYPNERLWELVVTATK